MGLAIDLHIHTRAHSPCSMIDPQRLIAQAVKAGLDGIVITEHHYQWSPDEIADLVERAPVPRFLVLAGFEYASSRGDLLVYGLTSAQALDFAPGWAPGVAVERVHDLGGACIGAHPTRQNMGFDDRIATLALDGIEVRSTNLTEHEQRLAGQLARTVGLRPVNASDAHQLHNVGRYATEFFDPICSMKDLQQALQRGRFQPVDGTNRRMGPV